MFTGHGCLVTHCSVRSQLTVILNVTTAVLLLSWDGGSDKGHSSLSTKLPSKVSPALTYFYEQNFSILLGHFQVDLLRY